MKSLMVSIIAFGVIMLVSVLALIISTKKLKEIDGLSSIFTPDKSNVGQHIKID